MNVIRTELPEVLIIEPKFFGDDRGFFVESYQLTRYNTCGIMRRFVQDNMSRSRYGVLRGLHLQNPITQGKLAAVLRGKVLDVAVDTRVGSPNFGRHVAVELSEQNRRQLWVPRGFAHGFLVLSQVADFFYKCDDFYNPEHEVSIRWDDPAIGINWGIEKPSLSAKDADAPLLADIKNLPLYGQV
ncbi:dTDP-4-dehydrorhamnose 3,5-epimerase [Bradyrhizobium diazoefficiens]|jgi:dTDP-4-dehydrorhamnose 3,5-epimerase|uniref:dTDP-4-dehydrorhamnose 3,5-epimerase n=1 Tax=Bradyrhizobium ottawaense TaxID=931866 RepID=A0ABV4FIB7_9BRAD|nr:MULTISPECIES: dTDP-4-dehydrorhamnose 3,5-epimerase [Bradyrhizobium]WLC03690.1 dTDP-4-dehydrorhamnose 3,5-epimerase [Bradyrhizobium japonicum USDA 123]MBR0866278.1 dTDP-4-dehydrorhamnose 3,5-epimerase [Bradyrhizobium diazoefficiens]MBR0883842.1 dTDP-4-dehydrorhamnose 3,5-epimerase [Bradyrhizobium liaoningense]MBR0890825.1 dTDP-4-dehydrorhamnose 3,5-epimerase [Bradyrhizobium diazoefficiens]MBR0922257.1 dTDP-4-dehydrorhamnose 3,5-epimerase [Bradyrhizobium diazoefficiens]